MPTLAHLERRAIEQCIERQAGIGAVDRAAAELGIGRATAYRRLRDWSRLDAVLLPAEARGCGVDADEVECILGRITQAELAVRAGVSQPTISRRIAEALRMLGRRRVPWGLALCDRLEVLVDVDAETADESMKWHA